MRIPFVRPNPPKLSKLHWEIEQLEQSGIYTNYGPLNARFENELRDALFDGTGACLTTCNATLGLMLAIRDAADISGPERRYALMPSFTFAAAPQAAIWCGLTPLLCDIDPQTWHAGAEAEEELLERFGDRIAVIVACTTFGNIIDLDRYERISRKYGIPIVVDAAGNLGCIEDSGRNFGVGFPHPIVFSMHATKSFATGEGGVIYSATSTDLIARLRIAGNFGFGTPRSATMAGLNSKLPEVGALLALAKLRDFERVVTHRNHLARLYRAGLPGWQFQSMRGQRNGYQFMPLLLPHDIAHRRAAIMESLTRRGIGSGCYFSPHVAQQPFFALKCETGPLPVTEDISARILCLPINDPMTLQDVRIVCDGLDATARELASPHAQDEALHVPPPVRPVTSGTMPATSLAHEAP